MKARYGSFDQKPNSSKVFLPVGLSVLSPFQDEANGMNLDSGDVP